MANYLQIDLHDQITWSISGHSVWNRWPTIWSTTPLYDYAYKGCEDRSREGGCGGGSHDLLLKRRQSKKRQQQRLRKKRQQERRPRNLLESPQDKRQLRNLLESLLKRRRPRKRRGCTKAAEPIADTRTWKETWCANKPRWYLGLLKAFFRLC